MIEPRAHPKFRLLVLSSDSFPPTRVDVAVLFGEELAGRGHQIDYILQSEADCDRGYVTQWGGGTVWVAPTNSRNSLLSRLAKHAAAIWNDARVFKLLSGDRYEAIEVKDKFIGGVFAVIAARLFRKRFVYWLSFPFPEFYLTQARDGLAPYPLLYRLRGLGFQFMLYRILLPAADHVFVQSDEMRRQVAAHGIALSKLTAVPMGIKMDGSVNAPLTTSRRHIPAGQPSFLYLGSLNRERRIDFLLRVLERVLRRAPETKLYLVGKGDLPGDEDFIKQEADNLGVTRSVIFTGQLPRQTAFEYVQDADVCVSPIFPTPIFNLSSPTKLVEYMAMGKAVVANTIPDQKLLIDASGCGYCVPWDEDAFAAAILELMRAPELARSMGERGRRYVVEHRSYGAIATTVERAMLQVVAA